MDSCLVLWRFQAINDQEFLAAFEDCSIPAAEYRHPEHLRTAWLYLRRDGLRLGSDAIASGIKRYAASRRQTDRYHETITRFWIHLVAYAIHKDVAIRDFSAFLETYPHLLDKGLLQRHYREATLKGQPARGAWVEPDLSPLPGLSA